jgi:replicative DNA helicase
MNNPPRTLMSNLAAPYSEEAEEAVIGAVLINPDSYLTVAAFLKHDDFYFLRHQYIWQALQHLSDRDEPVDYLTLLQELRDMNWLDEIGGAPYITRLVNNTPTSIHAEFYGRIVERAAIRRRLLVAADEIKALAVNEQLDIENVVVESEKRLFNVTDRQLKREFIPLRDAVDEYFDQIENLMQNPQTTLGVPSGFNDLDELLGGFQKSDLLIFAGRPGMGKTSFMLSTAVNAARRGARIAIFTMEMGADQLVQRMISMETGINSHQLRLGRLSQQEYARFVEAAGRISRFQIFIDDTPALNPLQMRTKCRRLQHEHGLDLVMVDYVQLMNAGGTYENNRVQEVSYISRALKELARELNTPIFSAAQLSRAVEQRQDKRPLLSDLRESGCLAGESPVYLPDEGCTVPIRELVGKTGFRVLSLNTDTWKLEPGTVTNAFCTGTKPVYRLKTQLGRTIRATGNHKFLTIHGWKRLDELTSDDHIALPRLLPAQTEQTITDVELGLLGHLQYTTRELDLATIQKPERNWDYGTVVKSETITRLAESHVYWDAIASIVPDGEAEVFDLTVDHYHNFVSGSIVVHNSLEQDADIVMFLYRDVVYNDATEFPNQADVIVAKHRNGATGTISLYFDNTLTKFMDGAVRRVDLGDV